MQIMVKKAFLRACMNFGILTVKQINDILPPICKAHNVEPPRTSNELKMLVNSINKDIYELDQALKFVMYPLLQTEYLVFVCTTENEMVGNQKDHSDIDRFFFRELIGSIACEVNYGIQWFEVYKVAAEMPNQRTSFTPSNVKQLVNTWTAMGYLLEKDKLLYFGPRMIVELGPYMKREFPDLIENCNLCNEVVFWGVECSDCRAAMHRKCIRKYLIRKSNCPACKRVWNTRLSVP